MTNRTRQWISVRGDSIVQMPACQYVWNAMDLPPKLYPFDHFNPWDGALFDIKPHFGLALGPKNKVSPFQRVDNMWFLVSWHFFHRCGHHW